MNQVPAPPSAAAMETEAATKGIARIRIHRHCSRSASAYLSLCFWCRISLAT